MKISQCALCIGSLNNTNCICKSRPKTEFHSRALNRIYFCYFAFALNIWFLDFYDSNVQCGISFVYIYVYNVPFCSICDEFEEMSMHAGERPKETAEVVALQNYLNECKDERIVKLKDEIKKAAERVVFLLHHATLDGNLFTNATFEDLRCCN